MLQQLQKRSTARYAIPALVLFVVFSVVWFNFGPVQQLVERANGSQILDNSPGYTVEMAQELMAAYMVDGRMTYQRFLYVDYLYGALFALTGLLLLNWLWRVISEERTGVTVAIGAVMLLSLLLEGLENSLMLVVLARYPDNIAGLLSTTSMITGLKFVLVNAITVAIVASSGLALMIVFYRRVSQKPTS